MKPFLPPALPPAIDWVPLVAELGRANRQLARYDGLLQGLVNPEVLLAPLRTREAVLSSKIEGTQATLEEVLEHEADPRPRPERANGDYLEILNYREAMDLAVAELNRRPLSLNLMRRVHRKLMTGVRGQHRAPGQFRRVQNYIGPSGAGIEGATFVPPSPEKVLPLMENLETYIHSEERDALAQAGLVHAQFEMIHPFLDGNGRVGRMLIPLFLYAHKVLSCPAFYLSAYLEAHREVYYARLRGVSEDGDYGGWLEFFLGAIAEQASDDVARIQEILQLYERMKEVIAECTRSKYALRTLDTLFASPLLSTPQFARLSGIPAPSAARILNDIEQAGEIQLVRRGKGRRPTVWGFPALLEIVR